MQENFRVTLTSNGSLNLYPDNKPEDFTIKLNTPKILDGDWEVALLDIFYNQSWDTFHTTVNLVCIIEEYNHDGVPGRSLKASTIQFKRGPRYLVPKSFDENHNVTADKTVISVDIEAGFYYDHVHLGTTVARIIRTAFKTKTNRELSFDYEYNDQSKVGKFTIKEIGRAHV